MFKGLSCGTLAACLVIAGCGGTDSEADVGDTQLYVEELVRTADPSVRGYTDADFPRVQELAPNVFSYEQLRSAGDEDFTTVSLFVVTTDGVVVADGQGSIEETQRMIDHIGEITDRPITHVVVCSDHGDHTAGNSAFPAGTEFIAHPTSAATLEASANSPRRAADAAPIVVPTRLVADREAFTVGETTFEVHFLGRAHTGGDLVVYLPEEKILFMSEAFLHRVFPAMRSAYPSEWVQMIERAQAMDVDVYVPGHGFVDPPRVLMEELEIYRNAVVQVIEVATAQHSGGYSLEDAQSRSDFGDLASWSLYSSQAPRAIQQVYAELDGELPGVNR
jgi:glyoxylase-like metal-dependent hydrolase (beta-lactamase superfamily II)